MRPVLTLVTERGAEAMSARSNAMRSGTEFVPPIIRNAGPEAVESFLGFFARITNRRTRGGRRCAVNHFLVWCEARTLTLDAIRAEHVTEFSAFMSSQWQVSTAAIYFSSAKSLFAHLGADRIIGPSPFVGVAAPRLPAPETLPPTLARLEELLCELDRHGAYPSSHRPGRVALYPLVIGGTDEEEIARATAIPLDEVRLYAGRLRESGLWNDDGQVVMDASSQSEGEFLTDLVLIVGCAAGIFKQQGGEGEFA